MCSSHDSSSSSSSNESEDGSEASSRCTFPPPFKIWTPTSFKYDHDEEEEARRGYTTLVFVQSGKGGKRKGRDGMRVYVSNEGGRMEEDEVETPVPSQCPPPLPTRVKSSEEGKRGRWDEGERRGSERGQDEVEAYIQRVRQERKGGGVKRDMTSASGREGRGEEEGGGGGGGSIYEHRPAAVKAVREMAASITVAVVESEGNLIAGWKDASQDMKETSKELSSEVSSSSSLLRIQAEAIPFAWLGEVSTVLSLPLLEAVEVMEVIASDIAKEVLCQGRIISTLPTLDKAKQGHARRLWKEQRYVRWSYVEKLRQALSLPSSKKGEEEEGGG
uniref:Uncharacterized protein n=1 Tax=Palpitomonas bilix TaxID=652834 RepID=A0A7S3GJN6_9EUKA